MTRFKKHFCWLVTATWLMECLACHGQMAMLGRPTSSQTDRGEFGSDLRYLRRYYTPPQRPGESNHFFDLWEGQKLREVASISGLSDNHALLINSHGESIPIGGETRYAFCPHRSLLRATQKPPDFSASDLAKVIGPAQAGEIHNILIGGCNSAGNLSSVELRKFFPNATNIIHMAAGQLGYESMFFQVLLSHSEDIKPIYETKRINPGGRSGYYMGPLPECRATKLNPYVAELFKPGANEPFQTRIAGRELLDPQPAPAAH
jgi:hypothetical protein